MKKYITPEMEIKYIEETDIIQTSAVGLELNGVNAGTVKYSEIPDTATEAYDITK